MMNNPKIFAGPRGCGKSTEILKWCEANEIEYLFVDDEAKAHDRAFYAGVHGVQCVPYSDYFKLITRDNYAIDNITKFMEYWGCRSFTYNTD